MAHLVDLFQGVLSKTMSRVLPAIPHLLKVVWEKTGKMDHPQKPETGKTGTFGKAPDLSTEND